MGTKGLLAGVRVLDLSAYLPGPFTSRLLCDLGAEVIKLEHPSGDPVVDLLPGVYNFVNRGKRVVRVDLKNPAGRDFALQLAATADVLIEAFRPGVTDRLGLAYSDVAARSPRIIYCSISSHGQDGPARDRVGHNLGFEAAGGVFAPAVAAGQVPTPSPTAIADTGGGAFAALTICAALYGRESGRSLHLDVSLEEVVAYLAASRWGDNLQTRRRQDAPDHAGHAPGLGLFKTSDGRYLALGAVEDKLWTSTCEWLGAPELARAPYDTHSGRMADRDALRSRLSRQIESRPAHEWLASAEGTDVPIELARSYGEVASDEHLRSRGFVRQGQDGTVLEYPVRLGSVRSACGDGVGATKDDLIDVLNGLGLAPATVSRLAESQAFPDL